MKKYILCLSLLAVLLAVHGHGAADDIGKIAAQVREYIDAGNYSKALDELAWYQKEIEKLHFARILDFFKEKLDGNKRLKTKTQSTVGYITVEATYGNEGEQIEAVLSGGNASAGAMGGLTDFRHLGAMQGAGGGHDSFRLNGFTAMLNHQRRRPELSVFLDSGWILKIVAPDASTARSFVCAFPTVELNQYLKGN